MIYAELGITPISIHIKSRMIGLWLKIVNTDDSKLSKLIYNIMQSELHLNPQYKWLNFVKNILISGGRVDQFNQTSINNPEIVKIRIIQTLDDLNMQEWHSKIIETSKGRNYKVFKDDQKFEPYLRNLPRNAYIPLKFRTGNRRLPVETGRWEHLPYSERKVTLCEKKKKKKKDIGDEFHYLLICPSFASEKNALLKQYYISPYINHSAVFIIFWSFEIGDNILRNQK